MTIPRIPRNLGHAISVLVIAMSLGSNLAFAGGALLLHRWGEVPWYLGLATISAIVLYLVSLLREWADLQIAQQAEMIRTVTAQAGVAELMLQHARSAQGIEFGIEVEDKSERKH